MPNGRIYVIARDQADFDDYAYPASAQEEFREFDFLALKEPIEILERRPAIIHITKNAKQHPQYRQMLMNISLLDIPPAVHEFHHDVPKALTPAGIEEWLNA